MRPRDSLILVGDDSQDAIVLAGLLARATAGTEVIWTDPLIDGLWDTRPGLMVVRGRRGSHGERPVDSLAESAPCPVALAPIGYAERAPRELRRIGVGFDGWDESRVALAEAAILAEGAGADLVVLMAGDPHAAASTAERNLERVLPDLSPPSEVTGRILSGPVARALTDACALEGLDLLVLGSARQGPLGRVLPGSVSGGLLRHPPQVPLLVCARGIAPPLATAALAAAGAAA